MKKRTHLQDNEQQLHSFHYLPTSSRQLHTNTTFEKEKGSDDLETQQISRDCQNRSNRNPFHLNSIQGNDRHAWNEEILQP